MSPIALPLTSRREFASNDFAAMHERLCAVLKPHGLRRLSDAPVRGIIHRAHLGRIAFNVLRLGPAVEVTPGRLESFFLVQVPIAGAVELDLGNERVLCAGSTAVVVSPGERLRLRWSDNCTQLIVQIPRDAMEARLAARLGFRARTALRFQAALDLCRSASGEWRQLLDFAVRAIDGRGAFARGPLSADLEDLLLSALLEAQPHNQLEALRDACGPAPRFVLRAERVMRGARGERLTVARLAELAGVSERTLHDGFRRFRATTPMRRLSALRLAEARRRLRAAPPGATVAGIAADLGFLQPGRFAKAYRDAFGELPSTALRGVARASVS